MSRGGSYDDHKYGVITRRWFGLTKKLGGETAAGFVTGSAATAVVKVTRWYPRGPIILQKAGVFVLATEVNRDASADSIPTYFLADGASGSAGINVTRDISGSQTAPFTIASQITASRRRVKAGAYMIIKQGTPVTNGGTRITSSINGTVAFFVDYTAQVNEKWKDVGETE